MALAPTPRFQGPPYEFKFEYRDCNGHAVADMKPAPAPAGPPPAPGVPRARGYDNQHAAWAGQLGFNGFAANPWPAYPPRRGSGRTSQRRQSH